MQIIISNNDKLAAASAAAATKRFVFLAGFSVVAIIGMFLMLDYYSGEISGNVDVPVAAHNKIADNQPVMQTENIFEVVSQQQEEAREYRSNAIRAGFRRPAKTEENRQPHNDEKPFLPPKSPEGASY